MNPSPDLCNRAQPGENVCTPFGAWAGYQPNPHNPRKQRKNPAAAGSGEAFLEGKWRRGRDWDRTFSIYRYLFYIDIFFINLIDSQATDAMEVLEGNCSRLRR
ncbi:hypothetical protein SAMN05444004_1251 [Jannaschia faecimaris]|uniref:Uncharacterized protein n=1 Tax=Jannaschia faecimaris TaxID=1244108 RepID=A0A1H3U8G0_9RHOB|nr:hypothetical protein SAMN05444004_1251 [Jannaschia faecimaris]